MLDFEILATGPYRLDQVHANYSATGRRTARGDDQFFEQAWQAAQEQARRAGVPLYDGQLYRLTSFRATRDHLLLHLGDTGYKEYLGSRSPAFFRGRGRDELANPLAVCAAIVTADDRILVERRRHADVYRGRFHVIGGFCERDQDLGPAGPSPFLAAIREIREEVGLDVRLDELVCLGLVYDRLTPHPELCFTAATSLTMSAIEKLVPRQGEIDRLESIGADPWDLSAFLLANRGSVSVTGEACLVLYGGWRYGTAWREQLLAQLGRADTSPSTQQQ